MKVRRFAVLLFTLSMLATGALAASSEPKPAFTPEQLAEISDIMQKHGVLNKKDDPKVQAGLTKAKPVIETDKNSLAINGYGVPGMSMIDGLSNALHCQDGTLHYWEESDFDQHYWYFYFDSAGNFAQQQKQELDELAPYLNMKSMTPDLHARLQGQVDALKQARSVADLDYIRIVSQYATWLTGSNALTAQQLGVIQVECAQRQKDVEELKKLVLAREKTPDDARLNAKVAAAAGKYIAGLRTTQLQGKFFTPAQQHAMGMDVPAEARHHSSASASASAGSANKADIARMEAEADKRQQDLDKKMHAEAKVKFTLKGTGASNSSGGLQLPEGCMHVSSTAHDDGTGADYIFYYDTTQGWNTQKDKWKKAYDPKKNAALLAWMDKAATAEDFNWGRTVEALREKAPVPPEVEQHLAALIKDMDDACDALLKAYTACAAKPGDPALQRSVFDAYRNAERIRARNNTLCDRGLYADRSAMRDDIPWLLTLEQLDLASAGQLTTSSEMSSGTGGSISLSARPVGDKQYVGINATHQTVGDLAEKIESAAQKYYHNHKLKLTVDAAASDKPLKGMVEGKSAEELFKSFAQRAGLNLVKDEKNPDAFTMKL